MDAVEVCPGLWRWTAPHPAWNEAPDWPEDIGCIYYEASDALVLIDPLLPRGEEQEFLAALDRDVERLGAPVVVLLSAPWHRRDAATLADRYGAEVWAHEAGAKRLSFPTRSGAVPRGIEVFVPGGPAEGQVAFFLAHARALVVAEFFMGIGGGLRVCPPPTVLDRDAFVAGLRPLLDWPIERVLVSHGEPVYADGSRRIEDALAADLTRP